LADDYFFYSNVTRYQVTQSSVAMERTLQEASNVLPKEKLHDDLSVQKWQGFDSN
jgi:hypothetical protein